VVDTSRDISDAVVRKRRSSAMAGSLAALLLLLLLLGCLDMISPDSCEEEADCADDAVVAVAPPRMEVMAPVAGMARAMAKNSLVRSAMMQN